MRYLLVFLMLMFSSPVFGATQLKKTVCPSGCDYTSLEAAMNGNEQDLTAKIAISPLMASNSSPSPYVISASSNYPAYEPYYAFNNATSSWISAAGTSAWLKIDMGSASNVVTSYSLKAPSDTPRTPKDWTLQGSNDDTNWTTVDTVTGQTAWSSGETREFTCDTATTRYRYYKLDITAVDGGSYVMLDLVYLYSSDRYFDVEISGTWSSADTTAVTIHNYTTDATRYINIYTTGDARHDGTAYKSGAYKSYYQGADGSFNITVSNNYVSIKGIVIKGKTGAYTSNPFTSGTSTDVLLESVVFETEPPTLPYVSSGNMTLRNCVIVGGMSGSYYGTNYVLNLQNCTFSGSLSVSYYTVNATNVYASSFSGVTQTNCASGDTTATGSALDNIAYSTSNFTNVTSTTEDLHLAVGSALINVGTDLSGTFTTDIDGTTRTGTWDIGADEFVSASTPSYGAVFNGVYGGFYYDAN